MAKTLFELNPALDREELAARFASRRRIQIRDVLTNESAREIRDVLARGTAWGMATAPGDGANSGNAGGEVGGPAQVPPAELNTQAGQQRLARLTQAAGKAAARGDYAFCYAQYSLVQGYLEKWNEGGAHDLLIEYLNTPKFLGLVREVTGMDDLIKADGQATLYAPQHFLGLHTDSHVAEGWKVAYVLNLTVDDWKPDWGGYLNFFDQDGNIECAFRPRFNSLNMFAVPQAHSVGFVPPFAPLGRYAITGWVRNV
ncbi:2OG-Fe(II) oxygenase [Alteripontixanthobacter maritimus]|nr:2OG-Fe(II) oxygenase family protein [Alteripontixanthobacter maritimus]